MSFYKIRCLIIDDDPFIRELLQDKLDQYFPDIEVLSTASSGKEGLEKIANYNPELVFLDVEMADMTGFEMLSQLSEINFQTIFITSYSHYAIKAIRFNALDYLLKPIDLGELKKAIKRFKAYANSIPQKENLSLALKNIANKNISNHMLILKTQDGDLRLVLNEIIHIEGDRNYSYIHLKNGKKELVTKTLVELEELLDSKGFYRCHKSHILNAEHISSYTNGNFVHLTETITIPISRRKKKAFMDWFQSYKATN
ncbi:MAG: LytTR family DNA-binding domain-containing protein [Psychroserpens sp.]|uniref:LytR/AlgR family response regulator transcription factor n=1 Tax=Psychroserpens sp. TaxID=2020870 RepID=UPI0030036B2B